MLNKFVMASLTVCLFSIPFILSAHRGGWDGNRGRDYHVNVNRNVTVDKFYGRNNWDGYRGHWDGYYGGNWERDHWYPRNRTYYNNYYYSTPGNYYYGNPYAESSYGYPYSNYYYGQPYEGPSAGVYFQFGN